MDSRDLSADGALGVPHLRRLWRRYGVGGAQELNPADWARDQAVIYALGLGLRETLDFLHSASPSFAGFECWIVAQSGGAIEPSWVDRANRAVARIGDDQAALASGFSNAFTPVFDENDLRRWDEQGYLVLRDAVSPDDCAAAARGLWNYLEMDPKAPEGWYGGGRSDGIFVPLVHDPAFDRNRRSLRIRNAFAQLWGTDDLLGAVDCGGFNPPERPGWSFSGPGLHWDTSLVPPLPLDIGGVLYLTDTPAEQGAFHCVPGFHRRVEAWLAGLPPDADPRRQDLSAGAVRVPGRAGDMVLWHTALPHAASANRGKRPRLVQYIAYRPLGWVDARPWR
ncbi:MAG TPA: phytanoyl-CoA dioxygenase family protein [Stellaceae bacterium]|jgi:hypothetical protein